MSEWIVIEEGCAWPNSGQVVEVRLKNGLTVRALFECNIGEAGDWDLMPLDNNDEPTEDTIADEAVAWRATALDRSGGVGVRALIWEPTYTSRSAEDPRPEITGWEAKDPWGEHYTIEIDGDGFVVSHTALINDMHCGSEEEAKDAGQADHDSRIRSVLVDAPDPVAICREAREAARAEALRELLAKWVQRDESLDAAFDAAEDEHSEGDSGNANDIVEAALRALIDQEPSDG